MEQGALREGDVGGGHHDPNGGDGHGGHMGKGHGHGSHGGHGCYRSVAPLLALHHGQQDEGYTERPGWDTHHIETTARVGIPALANEAGRGDQNDRPDGHVDKKYPPPRQAIYQHCPHARSDGCTERCRGAPYGDDHRTSRGRKLGEDHG